MREVTISRTIVRSASGRFVMPEYKVWIATERQGKRRHVIAYSDVKKELERDFPHAHDETEHITARTGECLRQGCWRNPDTVRDDDDYWGRQHEFFA